MTVKNLIHELKKMPGTLQVYWADHDHGEYETNSKARMLMLIDKKNMTEGSNDKDCGCSDCFQDTPKKYVVIRP